MRHVRCTTVPGMSPRILIAEDDEASREGLQYLLAFWGYEVESAADGQGALERAVALRPSLIITDLAMPRMDGLALVHAVRTALPETRVIVVSGDEHVESLAGVTEGGTVDCLTKPVDLDRLKGLITATLGGMRNPSQYGWEIRTANPIELFKPASKP